MGLREECRGSVVLMGLKDDAVCAIGRGWWQGGGDW